MRIQGIGSYLTHVGAYVLKSHTNIYISIVNIMKAKLDEIRTAILGNPVLAYCLALGFIKVPTLKNCELILKSFDDKSSPEEVRQECANVLNRINQVFGSFLKGSSITGLRGWSSGTTMATIKGSPLGELFTTAINAVVKRAAQDVMQGISPDYIRSPRKGELVYSYVLMCATLRELGFEKFDRKGEAVLEMFKTQLTNNAKADKAEATVNIDNAPLATSEQTVAQLKEILKERNLPTTGRKAELVNRVNSVELVA